MKRSQIFSKWSVLQVFLLIVAILSIFLSCKKEKNGVQQGLKNRDHQNALMDWGQAANGRWIPYLLKKVKNENPQMEGKLVTDKFFAYLNVVVHAKMNYRHDLLTQMSVDVTSHPRFLDSLYRANYVGINASLADLAAMDSLWLQYQAIFNNDFGDIGQSGTLARTTLDTFTYNECVIPHLLDGYFTDISLLPNRYNTSVMQLIQMMDPNISGCHRAYATQISVLVGDLSALQNPDPSTCSYYQFQIEDAFYKWFNCPEDPGSGGSGGTGGGPGGGTGGTGGGTSPEDPYPPLDVESEEECERVLAKIHADLQRTGYMKAIDSARVHVSDNKEWGSAIFLSDYTSINTAFAGNTYSSNLGSEWINTFVWSASQNKYQVATVHTHPGDGVPSPGDVLSLVHHLDALKGKSLNEELAFFTHASVMVLGTTYDWIVVANDWQVLREFYRQEQLQLHYMDGRFNAFAAAASGDDAKALVACFTEGNTPGIRLFRSLAGANSFTPYRLKDYVIIHTCE